MTSLLSSVTQRSRLLADRGRRLLASSSVIATLLPLVLACGSVDRATSAVAGHGATTTARDGSYVRGGGDVYVPDARDCNGNALDGRETDVRSSSQHCGGCHSPCAGECENGHCRRFIAATNRCHTDDDCTVARFDETSATPCCTCTLIAVSKASAASLDCRIPKNTDAGISSACVLSCLQPSNIAARCNDGGCVLTP